MIKLDPYKELPSKNKINIIILKQIMEHLKIH